MHLYHLNGAATNTIRTPNYVLQSVPHVRSARRSTPKEEPARAPLAPRNLCYATATRPLIPGTPYEHRAHQLTAASAWRPEH